jgi:hypothetical protein
MDQTSDLKIGKPRSRYLIYTSAGDYANFNPWLRGKRDFDLWVTYYGKQGSRYKEIADFYNIHEGSKWQNLLYVYRQWPDILQHYEAVLVMDDDILITTASINRLFAIRKQYDLWICDPSFDVRGKIRHKITASQPGNFMRFVNFVENGCPVFRKDKLDEFMKVYDGSLGGNGVDYWYLHVLGPDLEGKVAIVDAVRCINPYDEAKSGKRECLIYEKMPWKELAAQLESRYGIKGHLLPQKEFGSIPNKSISDHLAAFYYRTFVLKPFLSSKTT